MIFRLFSLWHENYSLKSITATILKLVYCFVDQWRCLFPNFGNISSSFYGWVSIFVFLIPTKITAIYYFSKNSHPPPILPLFVPFFMLFPLPKSCLFCRSTVGQNSQELGSEYWGTRLSVCSLVRSANPFACSALLALLTHSLPRSWGSE